MDYFSKGQPIALESIAEESSISEKEPLVLESELPVHPSSLAPRLKKSKLKKALIIFVRLFLIGTFLRWVSHKFCHEHPIVCHHTHELSTRLTEDFNN